MIRIVVDALNARQGGGQTYLVNLFRALPRPPRCELLVLAPPSLQLPADRPEIRRLEVRWPVENPLLRTLWQRWALPRLLRMLGAEILFVPGGVVATRAPAGCRVVTMFRNMIPFDRAQRARYPLGWQRVRNWLLERAMLRSMTGADLVIFISEYARSVIEKRAPGGVRRSVVIPHGVNERFRANPAHPLPRPGWLPAGPYLLYVSTLDFYKAQREVVRGFALFRQRRPGPEKLVLAGPENSDYGRLVREEVTKLRVGSDVVFAGSVPYVELPAVYQHAAVNLFASESENCPNILLEALAAGRPILCSNVPPMPEFGGDAVLYFDPRSPEELAERLLAVIDDGALQARLGTLARERARRYDWDDSGRRTWEAILGLAATGSDG